MKEEKTDYKSLGAGAGLGGGIATIVMGLLNSGMTANNKAIHNENQVIRAENKITVQMIHQVNQRMDKYEDRSDKKTDQVDRKLSRIMEIVSMGTRDRFTKLDQEKYAIKAEARIIREANRLLSKIEKINGRLEALEKNTRK